MSYFRPWVLAVRRVFIFALLVGGALVPFFGSASAASPTPPQIGETIRAALAQAQFQVAQDSDAALRAVQSAHVAYDGAFAQTIARVSPEADQRVRRGLTLATNAVLSQDAVALAAARAQVWTALLDASFRIVEDALQTENGATAPAWFPLREFRRATRFSRPNADAAVAMDGVVNGSIQPSDALAIFRADLLDTYQARLSETLSELDEADARHFAVRRAELSFTASGLFEILAPSYTQQRGAEAAAQARADFAELTALALTKQPVGARLSNVEQKLAGFRAAPLAPKEQARRAGQLNRFLKLVPLEYSRGIRGGVVTLDLEIHEAITFAEGAAAAYSDLEAVLTARDAEATSRISRDLHILRQILRDAGARTRVAAPEEVQQLSDGISTQVSQIAPPEWSQRDSGGDFDVIATLLDAMEQAVASGQYELAESSRLEAYAVLESGPEARLIAFAPQLKTPIEEQFWYGQGNPPGLAALINKHAVLNQVKTSRDTLDAQLKQAETALSQNTAPMAVATNAGIIVFREGLEAVLILAAIMGSMKAVESRRLRRPIWAGVVLALIATGLTWVLAQSILSMLSRYGEVLEAVVSVIAIAVLLLITNWFFHRSYWTDWISSINSRKRSLLGQQTGQWIGLLMLGLTSVYREGFETVLFLQALTLESSATTVLAGVAVAFALVIAIGVITFRLQTRLPYKRMLVLTGIMIGAVLLVMVGNTVHVLQVIGWLPLTPLTWLKIPYWTGIWFGIFPTVEGLGAQAVAAIFVIGSFFLAERRNRRRPAEFTQTTTAVPVRDASAAPMELVLDVKRTLDSRSS